MHENKVVDNVEVDDNEIEVLMSKEDAEELTKGIQSTSSALYVLIKKAHDEKAWLAMGYKSWSSYIESEFDFSRARSYQLINQANVIEEINNSSGVNMYITERDARAIKKKLPEITEKLKEVKQEGLTGDEAADKVKEIIDESQEVDNAKKYAGRSTDRYDENDGWDSPEDYEEKEDTGSHLEEWKPDNVDNLLTDEERILLSNLITHLKFFQSMPDGDKFGKRIKESKNDKTKELIKLADSTFSWLTQLMDELE